LYVICVVLGGHNTSLVGCTGKILFGAGGICDTRRITMTGQEHALTNEELDRWWAERLELTRVVNDYGDHHWEGLDGIIFEEYPSPSTSWADFGVCYEFMRGRGWKAAHGEEDNVVMWDWIREGKMFAAEDPDILRAALLAGMKAEGGELECSLSPTGKHEYMDNGHCQWCREHYKGD
jgi:hypothetical protein